MLLGRGPRSLAVRPVRLLVLLHRVVCHRPCCGGAAPDRGADEDGVGGDEES